MHKRRFSRTRSVSRKGSFKRSFKGSRKGTFKRRFKGKRVTFKGRSRSRIRKHKKSGGVHVARIPKKVTLPMRGDRAHYSMSQNLEGRIKLALGGVEYQYGTLFNPCFLFQSTASPTAATMINDNQFSNAFDASSYVSTFLSGFSNIQDNWSQCWVSSIKYEIWMNAIAENGGAGGPGLIPVRWQMIPLQATEASGMTPQSVLPSASFPGTTPLSQQSRADKQQSITQRIIGPPPCHKDHFYIKKVMSMKRWQRPDYPTGTSAFWNTIIPGSEANPTLPVTPAMWFGAWCEPDNIAGDMHYAIRIRITVNVTAVQKRLSYLYQMADTLQVDDGKATIMPADDSKDRDMEDESKDFDDEKDEMSMSFTSDDLKRISQLALIKSEAPKKSYSASLGSLCK